MTNTKTTAMKHLEYLCVQIGPRPLGSPANQAAADYVRRAFEAAGLAVERQEFPCPLWEEVETRLEVAGERLTAFANTWSPACDVTAPAVALGTVEELEAADLAGRIGILYADLTKGHGIGARSAFYFPEEHQSLVRLLEDKRPAALVAVGPTPGCPERLIRDWEFPIPSATVLPEVGRALLQRENPVVRLRIESRQTPGQFANVVARKAGQNHGRIVLLAHLDTQADTPGACDNGSGVAVLLALAEQFARQALATGLEWLVVNGEEVGGVGDAAYLHQRGDEMGQILVAINVDGVGQWASAASIAVMGGAPALHDQVAAIKGRYPGVVRVEPWYESDHTAFFFQGVPCIPITSVGVNNVHLPDDAVEWISPAKLDEAVSLIADIVESLQDKSPAWCREPDTE